MYPSLCFSFYLSTTEFVSLLLKGVTNKKVRCGQHNQHFLFLAAKKNVCAVEVAVRNYPHDTYEVWSPLHLQQNKGFYKDPPISVCPHVWKKLVVYFELKLQRIGCLFLSPCLLPPHFRLNARKLCLFNFQNRKEQEIYPREVEIDHLDNFERVLYLSFSQVVNNKDILIKPIFNLAYSLFRKIEATNGIIGYISSLKDHLWEALVAIKKHGKLQFKSMSSTLRASSGLSWELESPHLL